MNSNLTTMWVCPECGCLLEDNGVRVEIHDRDYNVVAEVCSSCAADKYYECVDCGEYYDSDEYMSEVYDEDGMLCPCCGESGNFGFCYDCGTAFRYDDEVPIYDWRGRLDYSVCPDCAEREYRQCDECGHYYHDTAVACDVSVDGRRIDICDVCRDELQYCEECGGYFTDDNFDFDADMCNECAEEKLILSYDADIDWHLYGEDDGCFGIELEIENKRKEMECDALAKHLKENWLFDHAVYKHDGSLHDGFEIVTHPHTYDEFKKLQWRYILADISDHGYQSHDGGRCGLHIHVNRGWFGNDYEEQYRNIAKVAFVYNWCWSFFLNASRRTEDQYQRWASRYCCKNKYEDVCNDISSRDRDYGYRYCAINLTNSRTVEFRLGRGTLRYESFMAWIDIHLALVRNVRDINPETDLTDLTKWLNGISDNTREYLASRGLSLFKLDESDEL